MSLFFLFLFNKFFFTLNMGIGLSETKDKILLSKSKNIKIFEFCRINSASSVASGFNNNSSKGFFNSLYASSTLSKLFCNLFALFNISFIFSSNLSGFCFLNFKNFIFLSSFFSEVDTSSSFISLFILLLLFCTFLFLFLFKLACSVKNVFSSKL